MTAPVRHLWFTATRAGAGALALAVLLAAGCKSKDGGGGGVASSDPLIGGPGRIPKQNVPVPDRAVGGKGRSDPLLGSPTGRSTANATGYTDDPERFRKGPHLPGPGSTPAALAARPKDDGEGLKIDAPGVPLTPAGGTAPVAPASRGISDTLLGQLAAVGVKRGDFTIDREGSLYVFRVRVPNPQTGATRGYEGRGSTEAAAAQQALDQIRAERR